MIWTFTSPAHLKAYEGYIDRLRIAHPEYEYGQDSGRAYLKVWKRSRGSISKSVVAFVDRNANVYRADSWASRGRMLAAASEMLQHVGPRGTKHGDPFSSRDGARARRDPRRISRDVSSPGNPYVGSEWEHQLANDIDEVRETIDDYLRSDTWNDTENMSPGRAAAFVRARWPTLWRDAGVRLSEFQPTKAWQPPGMKSLSDQISHASRGQLRIYIHEWIKAGKLKHPGSRSRSSRDRSQRRAPHVRRRG